MSRAYLHPVPRRYLLAHLSKDPEAIVARAEAAGIDLPVLVLPGDADSSNFDLWIGVHGHSTSIPTPRAAEQGCRQTSFGDARYLVSHIQCRDLLGAVTSAGRMLLGISD